MLLRLFWRSITVFAFLLQYSVNFLHFSRFSYLPHLPAKISPSKLPFHQENQQSLSIRDTFHKVRHRLPSLPLFPNTELKH
jgi:hypothetical protein